MIKFWKKILTSLSPDQLRKDKSTRNNGNIQKYLLRDLQLDKLIRNFCRMISGWHNYNHTINNLLKVIISYDIPRYTKPIEHFLVHSKLTFFIWTYFTYCSSVSSVDFQKVDTRCLKVDSLESALSWHNFIRTSATAISEI